MYQAANELGIHLKNSAKSLENVSEMWNMFIEVRGIPRDDLFHFCSHPFIRLIARTSGIIICKCIESFWLLWLNKI